MKKQIVFFHLNNNFSGSPKVLADVIFSVKTIYNVKLITSNTEGFLSCLNIKKSLFSYAWNPNKLITLVRFLYAQLCFVFYALLNCNSNTVFYINTQQPSIVGLIARLFGIPVIIHVHETSSSQQYFGRFYRLFRKWTNGNEIFVSKYIQNIEEINSNRSKVIYNTVSDTIHKNSKLNKYVPVGNGVFNVLMICSLKDYKGIPELFQIAASLKKERDIRFHLIVDANQEDIDEYLLSSPKTENIKIYPRVSSPDKFLKKSSLLLSLSRIDQWVETFGLTIIEAMTYGIPCIVPPVGGPVEIVDHGVNGYCISSYDTETIVNKIKELSKDSEKCKLLSTAALKKSEIFTPQKFEHEILTFLAKKIG